MTWLFWVVSAMGQTEIAGAAQLRRDRGFGDDGVVRASFGPTFEEGLSFTAPSLQPDGSVTALGQRGGSRRSHVLSSLVRFSPSGESKRIRSFPHTTVAIARDATGGWVRIPSLGGISERVERLEPDGQVDRSFGHPLGKRGWASDRAGFQIDTLLPLPSGEVLVAGGENVARFRGDGSLDTEFGREGPGSEGRTYASLGRAVPGLSGEVIALLAAGEGRTVVVTSKPESQGEGGAHSHVLVLDRSGQLDPDFQTAVLNEEVIAAQPRADGGVVLLGARKTASVAGVRWISGADIFVAELDRGGRLDPGFGGGGVLQLHIGTIDEPRSLLVLADGSIAIGGSVVDAAHRCRLRFGICDKLPFVARLTPHGSLDRGFGSAGVRRLGELPGTYSSLPPEGVLGLTETTAGGLIAAGGSGPDAFVVRLTPRGRPDSRFGKEGVARERLRHRSETTVHSMAFDSRGRLLVAGLTNAGAAESNRSTVFRFLPNGRRDRSFGGGRGFAQLRDEGEALELAPDRHGGTYVLSRGFGDEMWIAHLRRNGALDRRFGTGGFVELQLSAQGSTEAEGSSVRLHHLFARLPGGGLIVVGRSSKRGREGLLEVRRLSARGHAVRSFGDDGVLVLGGPRLESLLATDTEISRDGDIMITGALPKPPREDDGGELWARRLAVVKILPEGRLDHRFGHGGVATPRVRGATRARTVLEADDGSLLLAAQHWSYAPTYPKLRPLLLRLDRDGRLEKRFGAAPTRGEERYEAAAHAKRMRQLIVAGKEVLLVSEDLPSLLAYDLDGRCEGYLPLSRRGGVRTTAAAAAGREVIVATHPFFSTGFGIVLRAFRAR
ncbi:MAG TPA: hypothetical protein VNC16_04435 [Solirubrobacterales bacterium]|jgi:uncharacterized delta-60 repeat protein|nr:hypothetical protein [Solirubrobacterales bacterium]